MAVRESELPTTHDGLAEQLAATAHSLRQSTVQVRSGRVGHGSGVIWHSEGLVVTNAHVVRGPVATVALADGRTYEGKVEAHDPERDLAALQVSAAGLPAAAIGDSGRLRVGQLVLAVGNPLGLDGALASGIIHAVPSDRRGRSWVQADIRLLPGNSGGPLADAEGRVIGVNSMVSGGLGLAVPSHVVQRFLGLGGNRPQLGVTLQPVAVALGGRPQPGLLVLAVAAASAAEAAGIIVGDVLIGVDGRSFQSSEDLLLELDGFAPEEVLRLDLLRGGKPRDLLVTLAPADAGEGRRGAAA